MKNRQPDLGVLFPALSAGRTVVLGILNITPDSFSDGGLYLDADVAKRRALSLVTEGADALDIGAESTRPGAPRVSPKEQWTRLQPVLDGLEQELKEKTGRSIPLSIDTRDAFVARQALAAGAQMINDVSGGGWDPEMLPLVAESAAPFILMHMRGDPSTMGERTDYGSAFWPVIHAEISTALEKAHAAGVRPEQIILDPGLGFAKSAEQSWMLVRGLARLRAFGRPLLLGPSRKSFLRLGIEDLTLESEALDRLTLVAVVQGILQGASFVRIHNPKESLAAIRLTDRLKVLGQEEVAA